MNRPETFSVSGVNCRRPTCPADPMAGSSLAHPWSVKLASQAGQAKHLVLDSSLPCLESRSGPCLRSLNSSAFPFWSVAAAASLPHEGWPLVEGETHGGRASAATAPKLPFSSYPDEKKEGFQCRQWIDAVWMFPRRARLVLIDWMCRCRELTQDEKLSARTLSSPHSTNAVLEGGRNVFSRDALQMANCITVAVVQLGTDARTEEERSAAWSGSGLRRVERPWLGEEVGLQRRPRSRFWCNGVACMNLATHHHPAERKAPPHSCHVMAWAATEDGHIVSPTVWRQDEQQQQQQIDGCKGQMRPRLLP